MGILNYQDGKVSGESLFLSRHCPREPGAVVFDIGANVGYYSKAVLSLNQDVSLYAFEPHPATYKLLCRNLSGRNVNVNRLGIGSSEGQSFLYDYQADDGSEHASIYKDVIENLHHSKSTSHEVDIVTVDDYCEQNDISCIALLKIDTEGNEFEVLSGARRMISEVKIEVIHFEFNEMNVSSRTFFRDFWELLHAYDIYRLLGNGMIKIEEYSPVMCEIYAYQNIVAIKK